MVLWPLAWRRAQVVQRVFRTGQLCKGLVREVIVQAGRGRSSESRKLRFAYRWEGETLEKTVPLPRGRWHLGDYNQLEVVVDPAQPKLAFIPDLFV